MPRIWLAFCSFPFKQTQGTQPSWKSDAQLRSSRPIWPSGMSVGGIFLIIDRSERACSTVGKAIAWQVGLDYVKKKKSRLSKSSRASQ